MINIVLDFFLVNIFFTLWIIFWLCIFIFAYFDVKIDSLSVILGLMLAYIILFPVSRRIVIFLTLDMANLRNITVAFIILIVFILLLTYTLLKKFTSFNKENKVIINFSFLIDQGYKTIFEFFVKFEFVETWFFIPLITFLQKNVKTNERRLYLYLIFNAIPKSIFFSSLLYDINMLQKLHYSLYSLIFLLFPVIFSFFYKMIKIYSKETLDGLATYLHVFEDEFDKEETDALLKANLNPKKHGCIRIQLIRPHLEEVTEEWFAYDCMDVFGKLHKWAFWCSCTEEFFNDIVYFRFTVIFLVIQILCQITTIINQW